MPAPSFPVINDPAEWGLRSAFGGHYKCTPEKWMHERGYTVREIEVGEDVEFILGSYAYEQDFAHPTERRHHGAFNYRLLRLGALMYKRLSVEDRATAVFLAALRCPNSAWHPLGDYFMITGPLRE